MPKIAESISALEEIWRLKSNMLWIAVVVIAGGIYLLPKLSDSL